MEQIDGCITYWQEVLAKYRPFFAISVVVLIEATITYLQALKAIQGGEK